MKRLALGLCALLTLIVLSACQAADAPQQNSAGQDDVALQVYLVRHAEKTTAKDDPALTPEGEARAETLAVRLVDAGITRIHSSDYTRTRDTAAPLAAKLGVTVELYDPRDLPAIAAKLQAAGGTHLVVGHSNTTGELTELLGGDGGTPIVEATEYDRLYIVTTKADGTTGSELVRFGE